MVCAVTEPGNWIARQDDGRHIAHVKVLFNCSLPFSLAHGGQAIQILQTMKAMEAIGIEVEPMRWWDEQQQGDLIHYVGRMPADHIRFAHQKGMKVVMAELLSGAGSQTRTQRVVRRIFRWGAENLAPNGFAAAFQWEPYQLADGFTVNTSWEKFLIEYKFDADPAKIHVIPNGVETVFFNSARTERGPWLVCTATITERKRVLELAQAAIIAEAPVWVIGKAYADDDPYAQKFFKLARENPKFIRFEGPVNDRAELAKIYRLARGFVLLSTKETQSLSSFEAAACECPLLLSDLPWAHSSFDGGVKFCPISDSPEKTATFLRTFYNSAPQLERPPQPATWTDTAFQFKSVYEKILSAP